MRLQVAASNRDWTTRAACSRIGSAVFFDPARVGEALTICGRCPVSAECLTYAQETRAVGVWGGHEILERWGER